MNIGPDWRQADTITLAAVEKAKLLIPDHNVFVSDVTTDEWEQVCPCRFGEGRVIDPERPKVCWTGKSHRYDIYRKKPKVYDAETLDRLAKAGLKPSKIEPQYGLRWSHGGGDGWLLLKPMRENQFNILAVIAAIADEPTRWDHCHLLYETATSNERDAANAEAAKYAKAFVEKRLTKRKVRGKDKYVVEITPPATPATTD
jgi:hypothetical protein